MATSVKVKILPAVKTAYAGGFRHFGAYAKISWPYVAIILLFSSFYGIDFSIPFLDDLLRSLSSFVRKFLRYLLEAIFVVGFYRFLLLKDTEHLRAIAIKRGIEKTKNLLAIPVYFRFGVREVFASSIGLAYIGLKILNSKLLIYIFYTQEGTAQPTLDHPTLYAIVSYSTSLVFFPLLAAALIFLWPYVATAGKVDFRGAVSVIKAMRGNIIRVLIVSFLIYQPAYFHEELLNLWPWVHFYVLEKTSYSGLLLWFVTSGPLWFFSSLSMLLKYCCLAAEMYFVHSIYREIVLKEAVGTNAGNGVTSAY